MTHLKRLYKLEMSSWRPATTVIGLDLHACSVWEAVKLAFITDGLLIASPTSSRRFLRTSSYRSLEPFNAEVILDRVTDTHICISPF